MHPFTVIHDDANITLRRWEELDVMISAGPTTLPQRNDVLLGSRYSANFLGAYDRWLDYHPGNTVFRQVTFQMAQLYDDLVVTASDLGQALLGQVESVITRKNGRFLEQDYRTGDWRVMSDKKISRAIHEELLAARRPIVGTLKRQIEYAIADCRFGFRRGTALAALTQLRLWHLKNRLLGVRKVTPEIQSLTGSYRTTPLSAQRYTTIKSFNAKLAPRHSHRASSPADVKQNFREGTLVWVYFPDEDNWYPGAITSCYRPHYQFFDISYNDGLWESHVERRAIRKRRPLVEGDSVETCYGPRMSDCYKGVLRRVMPSGDVSVYFPDEDITEWRVPPERYFIPPYRSVPFYEDEVDQEEYVE
mmetsp:Transcript_43523/g.52753  ORF Transcript_43523/g.52753 Transcript_43523/m.52753 type:complete len:362 (+) Transcript_43523:322-1407(+)